MTRPYGPTLLALLLLASSMTLDVARAGETKRKVHVFEQRPYLQAMRVELTPMFGYTTNEVMYNYLQVAGTLRFHINEQWAIGGNYGHYFSDTTSTFELVQDELSLFPEKSFIQWYAGGEVNYTPVYGKFILFGSAIVHWNAFLTQGFGVTQTATDGVKFTYVVGAGVRMFLTRWLTFHLELKDHIYTETFKAGDELINNLVLHAGFGIFIPFGFEYKYPK